MHKQQTSRIDGIASKIRKKRPHNALYTWYTGGGNDYIGKIINNVDYILVLHPSDSEIPTQWKGEQCYVIGFTKDCDGCWSEKPVFTRKFKSVKKAIDYLNK